MPDPDLSALLDQSHAELLAGAQARLAGDPVIRTMAAERGMTEAELVGQVLEFWLQAIQTDIALGSTVAMEQNIGWLVRLRDGQQLPFRDEMVLRMFDSISAEVDARITSASVGDEYAHYRVRVRVIIAAAFPGTDATEVGE